MIRRVPILPTVLVLAAVALMIGLGFWQIGRLHQKQALLARYAAAQGMTDFVPWPRDAKSTQAELYRRARIDCRAVAGTEAVAGRSANGTAGIGHVAQCLLGDGTRARVVLGWSSNPRPPDWRGGIVTGTIAPGPRLVAEPPLAGLAPNEPPDPSQIPNNHLSYAVQWFLFAVTALVIYGLALSKRLSKREIAGPSPQTP